MSANSSQIPQIFKVISPEIIRNKKMMLSGRFMTKFKSELAGSDKLTLEVPDGRAWTVGWVVDEKHPYKIWLVSGFGDFLRFYSITPNQILFFRHIESTRLEVVISRSTSMEIAYPPPTETGRYSDKDNLDLWERLRKNKKMILSNKFKYWSFASLSVNTKRAIQRALEEKQSNVSTMVVIKPNHMRPPSEFIRKFCSGKSETVRLQVGEGTDRVRTWLVEFKYDMKQWRINGWFEFRVDNQLVEGDVCVFELIPPSEGEVVALKVRIFRAAD
ncbi:B3 domain-containing protein REM19 [Linum grandiflorum]